MYVRLVYDHRFFGFLAQLGIANKKQKRIFDFIAFCLKYKVCRIPLIFFERLIALIITLPIPIYSSIMYVFIKSVNGYFGYYIRSIYYSNKAKKWAGNIIIDEDVILENIKKYEFDEFVMIDKSVIIGAGSVKIGKGCHIAMGTIISKGGEIILEDYSAISYGSILITASDSPDKGHRTSGPMIPDNQRNVINGTIILRKDSWVTSNVVVLPNTTIGQGSIVSPNSVISKNVQDWKIRLIEIRKDYLDRERIKFSDPQYH